MVYLWYAALFGYSATFFILSILSLRKKGLGRSSKLYKALYWLRYLASAVSLVLFVIYLYLAIMG